MVRDSNAGFPALAGSGQLGRFRLAEVYRSLASSPHTECDEFDATDLTEEDIDQIERRRAQIGQPLNRTPLL